MPALPLSHESATLIAFPGAACGHAGAIVTAALQAHRLPGKLAAQLLRAVEGSSDPETALADALAARIEIAPLDLVQARGILLIGAGGAGKSSAATAIAAAALPRETFLLGAREGLARLRAGTLPQGPLLVMATEDFHPLNPKARGAFAALSDIAQLEAVGVVSADSDAEDVAEMVTAFRFKRIIVTGLDRTRRLGAFLAAATSGACLAQVVRDGKLEIPVFRALAAALLAPRPHS